MKLPKKESTTLGSEQKGATKSYILQYPLIKGIILRNLLIMCFETCIRWEVYRD